MERGRAAGQCGGVLETDPLGQLPLEQVDMGSERCEPVRVEGVEQELSLDGSGVGGRQVDAWGHVESSSWQLEQHDDLAPIPRSKEAEASRYP